MNVGGASGDRRERGSWRGGQQKALNVCNCKKRIAVGIEHQVMLLDFLGAESIHLIELASDNRFVVKLSRIHGVDGKSSRQGRVDVEYRTIPRGRKISN